MTLDNFVALHHLLSDYRFDKKNKSATALELAVTNNNYVRDAKSLVDDDIVLDSLIELDLDEVQHVESVRDTMATNIRILQNYCDKF